MNNISWSNTLVAGVIGLAFALVSMWVVGMLVADPDPYIAASIAGFCGAAAGYIAGSRDG